MLTSTSAALKENGGRLCSFKNKGKDQAEMRRRRNDVTVELRKAKREEQMLKRRNVNVGPETTPPNELVPLDLAIPGIIENVMSENIQHQLAGVQLCTKLLSVEANPPLDSIIESSIVPRLAELLGSSKNPSLQFEAAWVLTNIASGSSHQTRAVVEAKAVPIFVQLLSSTDMSLVNQAVMALGNIAGDGTEGRDATISCGIIRPLIALIKPTLQVTYLRNVAWTLSTLCRYKNPPPSFETVQRLLPVLAHLLQHNDNNVASDACWALSYVTDGSTDRIQVVMDTGVVPRLAELLGSNEIACVIPALRTTGNIVTGSNTQTQILLDSGILKHFTRLLRHHDSNIQKEAAWTISNITAGQPHQIQCVVDAGLVPAIIDIMIKGEYRAQREAVWAIKNLTAGGTIEQIVYIVTACALKPLCDLLVVKETEMVTMILDILIDILNAATKIRQVEQVRLMIEECGGLDKIEALQQHHNVEVYCLTLSITDKFFSEEEMDQTMVTDTTNGTFRFSPVTQTVPTGGFYSRVSEMTDVVICDC